MPNYIIIHRASNLIAGVSASGIKLKDSLKFRAIRASEAILLKYYRLVRSHSRFGTLVDAGELANKSPAFFELLQLRQ